jgi:hypothetical protein
MCITPNEQPWKVNACLVKAKYDCHCAARVEGLQRVHFDGQRVQTAEVPLELVQLRGLSAALLARARLAITAHPGAGEWRRALCLQDHRYAPQDCKDGAEAPPAVEPLVDVAPLAPPEIAGGGCRLLERWLGVTRKNRENGCRGVGLNARARARAEGPREVDTCGDGVSGRRWHSLCAEFAHKE